MGREKFTGFIQNNIPAPKELVEEIASNFEERIFAKNEYFLREGRPSNEYLFLEEGFLRAYTHDYSGNEVTTYFYARGAVVFEASSFFMRTISTESIQALTESSGYVITFDKLNMLFHAIPQFREFGRSILVKEFAAYKQRTLGLINETAEVRYNKLVETNKDVFQYAQLRHIASYLGITDTSLSRIRKEFSKK